MGMLLPIFLSLMPRRKPPVSCARLLNTLLDRVPVLSWRTPQCTALPFSMPRAVARKLTPASRKLGLPTESTWSDRIKACRHQHRLSFMQYRFLLMPALPCSPYSAGKKDGAFSKLLDLYPQLQPISRLVPSNFHRVVIDPFRGCRN